jgi:hypothetical protein
VNSFSYKTLVKPTACIPSVGSYSDYYAADNVLSASYPNGPYGTSGVVYWRNSSNHALAIAYGQFQFLDNIFPIWDNRYTNLDSGKIELLSIDETVLASYEITGSFNTVNTSASYSYLQTISVAYTSAPFPDFYAIRKTGSLIYGVRAYSNVQSYVIGAISAS